jgi:hypothetical protein
VKRRARLPHLAFGGSKSNWASATDAGGLTCGWVLLGSCTPPVNLAPSAVSVSPTSGTGNATFTYIFSDPNGADNISVVRMLINSTPTHVGGCSMSYVRDIDSLSRWRTMASPPARRIGPVTKSVRHSSLTGAPTSTAAAVSAEPNERIYV